MSGVGIGEQSLFQIEQATLNADQKRLNEQCEAEHKRAMEQREADLKHDEKMARIGAKKVPQAVKETVKPVEETVKPFTLDDLKQALRGNERPNMTQLAKDFGVSRPTLYNRLSKLVDSGEVVKNGNGYEIIE